MSEPKRNIDGRPLWDRAFYQQLREDAWYWAQITPNEYWKQAYFNLAYAADAMDAQCGRSTISPPTTEPPAMLTAPVQTGEIQ